MPNPYGGLTHGLSKMPSMRRTYQSWKGLRQRCLNKNNPNYKNYGARGISVCERWDSFENFFADMGHCPPHKSIDRIDNDGHYEPGNCRWATPLEQSANQRPKRFVVDRRIDISGHTYGRLTAVRYSHSIDGRAKWLCECVCGKTCVADKISMRFGTKQSCGCMRTETIHRAQEIRMADVAKRKASRIEQGWDVEAQS